MALIGTINPDNTLSFRNKIINGAMEIDQRSTGTLTLSSTGNTYTMDRWAGYNRLVASKFSVQQSTTAPTGFKNSLLVTSLSAYSVSSGDLHYITQFVEGTNIADLGWGASGAKTVTLSFWVRSSLTGTFGGAIVNSGSSYCYPFSYSISSANTFERKTITITGPTAGTWLTTTGIGLQVIFSMGTDSAFLGTANAWVQADNKLSVTGETRVIGTNGATWYLSGVQLEVGSTATEVERRPYGMELQLCQRYFQTYPTLIHIAFGGRVADTAGLQGPFWYFSGGEMRTTPSYTYNDGGPGANTSRVSIQSPPNNNFTSTNISAQPYTSSNKQIDFKSYNTTTGLSEGQIGLLRASSLKLSAEL